MKTPEMVEISRHRNGVSGAPFHAVLFKSEGLLLLATVFPEPGRVAVVDPVLAAAGVVTFGRNSFRGDAFEGWLRSCIADHDKAAHP